MKKYLLAGAAALAALVATPALAQTNADFTGVRAELQGGIRDVNQHQHLSDFDYGASVGLDAPIGDRGVVGVEGTVTDPFNNNGRVFGVGARAGIALAPRALVFARAGYANFDDARSHKLDGLAVGGGAQFALSPHTYIEAQYRHTFYNQGVHTDGAVVGLGFRF